MDIVSGSKILVSRTDVIFRLKNISLTLESICEIVANDKWNAPALISVLDNLELDIGRISVLLRGLCHA